MYSVSVLHVGTCEACSCHVRHVSPTPPAGGGTLQAPFPPRAPQPGSSSSVSLLAVPALGTAFVLRVVADAHCFNCEVINKQANHGLCDNAPTSTPYILGYQFGEVSAFVGRGMGPG